MKTLNRATLCIDPEIPNNLRVDVLESIFSWIRYRLDRDCLRDSITIGPYLEFGYMHKLLRDYPGICVESSWSILMIYQETVSRSYSVPKDYVLRTMRENDVLSIVEVYNKAFSQYEWFILMTGGEFRDILRRRKSIVFVVEYQDKIVGFVFGEIYRAVDGDYIAIVNTLAVDPNHRGKGLGKALMDTIIREFTEIQGVKRIFLDSVIGLENLYRRFGFREYRKWTRLIVSIPQIPYKSITLYHL